MTQQLSKFVHDPRADIDCAEQLNISVPHAALLRMADDPDAVLTAPEKVIGPSAKTILAFWWLLHPEERDWRPASPWWSIFSARPDSHAMRTAWHAWSGGAAIRAEEALRMADLSDPYEAHEIAVDEPSELWGLVIAATAEIAGAKWLPKHRRGELVYLPRFGFGSPREVPALPTDYGRREIA